jgi:hypothetical protein
MPPECLLNLRVLFGSLINNLTSDDVSSRNSCYLFLLDLLFHNVDFSLYGEGVQDENKVQILRVTR